MKAWQAGSFKSDDGDGRKGDQPKIPSIPRSILYKIAPVSRSKGSDYLACNLEQQRLGNLVQ